jgi:hypothetical protein
MVKLLILVTGVTGKWCVESPNVQVEQWNIVARGDGIVVARME